MNSGRFITVEGTEGVGKSTNIAFIKTLLEARGIEVVITREPGGTPLAEELRELLLAKRVECFDATAELLVVFAARAQHLNTVILPALAAGKWVLSDRFTDATYAYQGAGRGLPVSIIAALETMVQKGRHPDLTVLLDIDPRIGLKRASQRAELDRFESEQLVFFDEVRAAYLQRVALQPDRFVVVDAAQSLAAVQDAIASGLESVLPRWKSVIA